MDSEAFAVTPRSVATRAATSVSVGRRTSRWIRSVALIRSPRRLGATRRRTVMRKALSIALGIGLSLVGFVGALISVLAIIDPIASKMADDSDPFGPPATTASSALMLVLYLIVAGLGAWLTWRRCRRVERPGATRQ